jgi:putative endonuclease
MPYYIYVIYVLSNRSGSVLYTGVANNLVRRVTEHRSGWAGSFITRCNIGRLVYWEESDEAGSAIEREKQIKAGSRRRKIELIDRQNPTSRDLYDDILG